MRLGGILVIIDKEKCLEEITKLTEDPEFSRELLKFMIKYLDLAGYAGLNVHERRYNFAKDILDSYSREQIIDHANMLMHELNLVGGVLRATYFKTRLIPGR